MNICITNYDNSPQYIGGIKRVSSILAKEWIRECDVCFLAFSPKDNQIKEINGISQYHFPIPENILAEENIDYFTAFVRNNNIDIILHQHCDIPDFTELCARVAGKEKIKLVSTLHFAPTHKNDIARKSFFIKYKLGKSPIAWIKDLLLFSKYHLYTKHKNIREDNRNCRSLINHSDKFVLLSTSYIPIMTRQLKLEGYELAKITAINNPMGTIQQQFEKSKKKRVLWCGRVEYGMKRVDRMLEIWKSIAPHYPDWELYIMGSGDIEYFRDITRKYDIPNVHFTGFCNPYDYYKDSSILCMTSSTEGLPMVILEAQMFGCIPIAYNSFSSLQDFITDNINGFSIKTFDKKEFIARLEWLMKNEKERCRIAQECIKSAERFNVRIIAKQWLEMFENIMQEQ